MYRKHVVAKQEETVTGLAALLTQTFQRQQVNTGRPGGNMPSFGSGSMPSGERPSGNWNRDGNSSGPGGNRGN